jgi:hypothetical protein
VRRSARSCQYPRNIYSNRASAAERNIGADDGVSRHSKCLVKRLPKCLQARLTSCVALQARRVTKDVRPLRPGGASGGLETGQNAVLSDHEASSTTLSFLHNLIWKTPRADAYGRLSRA